MVNTRVPSMDEETLADHPNQEHDNSCTSSTMSSLSSIPTKPDRPRLADIEKYGTDYPAPASLHGDAFERTPSRTTIGKTMSTTLAKVRTKDSAIDPGPPPDKGWHTWSQAFLVHLVVFNTWGFINSFGLFQTFYSQYLHQPSSTISWIGSVQIWVTFLMGTFSGRATDAGFFKLTFAIGAVFQLFGMFMTSLCQEGKFWQVFLAQGLCVGFGNGLVFVPSMALCSTYFLKNRSLAIGIAASGSATGGLVFPAIAETLLPKVGFAWTVRVMGFVMVFGIVMAGGFLRPRLPPRKTGPIVEWSAFKELPYALFAIGMFLNFWGLYVGFYYVGSFGHDTLGTSQTTSINLLLTMNGIGLPGRIIPNYFADQYTGPLNMMLPFSIITGTLLWCWISVTSVASLWGFAICYGVFAAGMQSLFPATLTSLTDDPKKAGVRIGMVFSVVGFAVLTGPPIAGALIEQGHGSYLYAQVFSGLSMLLGSATLLAARTAKVGFKAVAKV